MPLLAMPVATADESTSLSDSASLVPHEMALNGHWISSEDLLTDGSSDEDEEDVGRRKEDQLRRLKRHRRAPREGANYREEGPLLGERVRRNPVSMD